MNTASDSLALDLDKVIADYLLAVETGDDCDLETICNRHPKHADGIRNYFDVKQALFDSLETDDSAAQIQIEGFEILREIGRGGMGIVFEAVQENLNRNVAIKVLREGALTSAAGRKRFDDEAKLIASFQHDHIVDVIQYGSVDNRPYMVMPLATGKSLNGVIQNGPLPQQTVAKIMLQVSDAIATAHKKGVVHRDIKPANILADADFEHCKVSDFGLAFWDDNGTRHTNTGDIIGTPGYIAPEIIRGESKGDEQCDVYSIGATMYALLTGVPPFRAATKAESLFLAMNSDPVAPRKLNQNLAIDIESICLKCMNPARERRYASAREIHADLQRFIEHKPVAARPVGRLETATRWARRNKSLAAAIAIASLLLLSLVGSGIYSYSRLSDSNQQLATSAEKQRQFAESSTASLKQSIRTVEEFFNKVGGTTVFGDTSATVALRKELIADGIKFLNAFLDKNRGNSLLQLEIVDSYLLLAKLHGDLAEHDKKKHFSKLATEFLEEMYDADQDDPQITKRFALALVMKAQSVNSNSGFEESEPIFLRAIEISRPLTLLLVNRTTGITPNDLFLHFGIRMSYYRSRFRAVGTKEAIEPAQQVVDEMEHFALQFKEDPTIRFRLSESCHWLAIMYHRKGVREAALQYYSLAREYGKQSVDFDPENEQFRRQWTLATGGLAHVLSNADDPDHELVRGLKLEALAHYKSAADNHPQNLWRQLNYMEGLNNTGVVIAAFDATEGMSYLKQAAELLDQNLQAHTIEDDPQNWLWIAIVKSANLGSLAGANEIVENYEHATKYKLAQTELQLLM